jgi:hypothetical protein
LQILRGEEKKPIIAPRNSTRAAYAEARWASANKRNGMMGCTALRSLTTNATSKNRPAASARKRERQSSPAFQLVVEALRM